MAEIHKFAGPLKQWAWEILLAISLRNQLIFTKIPLGGAFVTCAKTRPLVGNAGGPVGGPRRPSEIPTMDGFSRGLRTLVGFSWGLRSFPSFRSFFSSFRDSSLSSRFRPPSLERDFAPTGKRGTQGVTGARGGLATLVGAFLTFHPWAKGQERSDPHG